MVDFAQISTTLWGVFAGGFLETESRLFAGYLVLAAAIAFVVYCFAPERRERSFVDFAMPWRHWSHASHITDLKLFFFGRLFGGVEKTTFVLTATAVAVGVMVLLGGFSGGERIDAEWSTGRLLVLTAVLAIASDFCTYWVHRIHHERPELWPFHAVHHSAEVMTPVTVYRKHPVYEIISALMKGALAGAVQGLVLFCFAGEISVYQIGGANAVYVLFEAAGSNLRHTHVWIGFGPVFSRIFISPAQHQIHHSIDPKHYNRNYGEVFALWDWMFGTLYIPKERETLQFGLGDAQGRPLPQPHPDFRSAMVRPFEESARVIRQRWFRKPVQE